MRLQLCILVLGAVALVFGCDDDTVSTRVADAGLCMRPLLPTPRDDCADLRRYIHAVGGLNTDGYATAVAVAGGLAYVADGDGGVVVVDACDPLRMNAVGRWMAGGDVHDVAYLQSRLYVAGDDGLTVLGVGDPFAPVVLASRPGPGVARGIDVDPARRYAFVADDVIGLVIYDVSVPRWPSILGIENTPGQATGVSVEGNVAYVADALIGLRIVSVESPENPWLINAVTTPGRAGDVAVWNRVALVADGSAGLTVVDVSSPVAAAVMVTVDTADRAMAVAAADGFAYVADRSAGLLVFDLADPSAPVLVARSRGVGSAEGVAVADGVAFVANGSDGLRAVDARVPASPPELARMPAPGGRFNAIVAAGSRFYVADGNLGVTVGDWSGGELSRRGTVDVGGSPQRMTLYDGTLYVCADDAGVLVVDVDDPDAPVLVGELPGTAGAIDVAIADSVVFTVRSRLATPSMVDLRRPDDPPVDLDITGGVVSAVAAGRFFAYFVQPQGRLWISSLDARAPQPVQGSVPTHGNSSDVHVRGDLPSGGELLFVSNRQGFADPSTGLDYSAGVEVYDLSNPLTPMFVALIETSVAAERIAFAGDVMFVVGGRDGFEVFDVSDPLAPLPIGAFWQPDPIRDAAAVRGAILLAAGAGGLVALPPACE